MKDAPVDSVAADHGAPAVWSVNNGASLPSAVSLTTQDHRRPEWIELLSRERQFAWRIVIVYQVVLLGLVAIFSTIHWLRRLRRHLSKRFRISRKLSKSRSHSHNIIKSSDELFVKANSVSSSEGSLVDGKSYAPGSDEGSPLLPAVKQHAVDSHTRRRWNKSIRSFLMYQPRPIGFVNKTLPGNATTLFILCLFLLNAFVACYRVQFRMPYVFLFSDRSGLLFVGNLPWLYILAAKNQPLQFLTGHSYEGLNIFHRRLGEWLCLLALAHAATELAAWYYFLLPLGVSLVKYLTFGIILLGSGAFFSYELLYVTSLASFRQRWYELFLGSHVVLQLAALVMVYLHHHRTRTYVGTALAIFLIDRIVFRLLVKLRTVQAELAVLEDGQTMMLSADWAIAQPSLLSLRRDVSRGWQPMAHVFIAVPALGRSHRFQSHPFTIASAAPHKGSHHAWLSLIIRAHRGFTGDLLDLACNQQSVPVRFDGPYGSVHALEMLQDSDTAIVVAGGSGIAVAYPLLWALLHGDNSEDHDMFPTRVQQVHLIWIVQEASHLEWIGRERLAELQQMGLKLVLPSPTKTSGRPDVRSLLRICMGMGTQSPKDDRSIGVIVSGPDGLNRTVRNVCAEHVREGHDIDIAVEKFGW
ncbi:hypothetical protein K431DRAFT_280473 [Polychaeton citri CBS 116435]|uniref:FAD-binding FR-type domain-containing protein n=1 Tax=Polychaeton citri CBS 116435 TaxID=1314669 RepID=A0A9P4URL3_9PEZI|nr:hypothetical protein K431DRAFT_280473 [Polychaeton citri CBS 116435]